MSETNRVLTLAATTPPSLRNWRDWVGLIARLIPGAVFLFAGLTKITNIPWFAYGIQAYQIPFLQSPMSDILAHVLPVIEIVVGLLLILGLLTRGSATLIALLLLAFMGGIVWVWSQGISIDCGCFGSGGAVAPEETNYPIKLLENLGMTVLCGWLLFRPQSLFSLDHLLFAGTTSIPDTFDGTDDTVSNATS